MLLELKKNIIYGPVNSRRLGSSLGINLFPGTAKICPFDCVYCQYGWTKERDIGVERRASIPKPYDVADAVEKALRSLSSPPAYLTFSGNGEPTLHPDFPEILDAVKSVRDRMAPTSRMAVLSNSAFVGEARIRGALAKLDVRIMKLDCGTEDAFRRYDRPAPRLTLDALTEGLRELSSHAPVTIQSLWTGGSGGNLATAPTVNDFGSHPEVAAWVERHGRIKPLFVQVYSLDRDTPSLNLRKLDRKELEGIAAAALAVGIPASAFMR